MRRWSLRSLTSALLALALVAAGQTLAYASVPVTDGTTIVICSGDGPIAITIDDQGNPVPSKAPVHVCPDCVLHLIAAPDSAPPVIVRPATAARTVLPLAAVPGAALAAPRPQARGPPGPV